MTLDELYEEHESRLRRFARSLAHDTQQADELVQDTFLRAMGSLDLLGVLNPQQRRAWLYRTLKNLYIDRHRAWQREEELLQQLAREPTQSALPAPGQRLSSPFDLVPERYREIVKKRYVLGMNSREIGEELGIPAATVRSRLHLAMKILRAQRWKL